MHLTEDDLRVIWRDLYTDAARQGYGPRRAAEHASHYVDSLRADMTTDLRAAAAKAHKAMSNGEAVILPVTTRTAEDERRDVLAYLRSKLTAYVVTHRGMPADLGPARDNLAAQITLRDAVLIGAFENGEHVGAADREAVKP